MGLQFIQKLQDIFSMCSKQCSQKMIVTKKIESIRIVIFCLYVKEVLMYIVLYMKWTITTDMFR